MKNLKGNNKGFSLVELIVVIAIMGILAVTLAPRLTQYVERSRRASDQEVVNTIYTATKLTLVDSDFYTAFTTLATPDVVAPGTPTTYTLTLNADPDDLYTIANDVWTGDDTETNAFWQEFLATVGPEFTLKSNLSTDATQIEILYTIATGSVQVTLDYADDGYSDAAGDYRAE